MIEYLRPMELRERISRHGTDTSGFSALPTGYRNTLDGSFGSLGTYAYFWSSTESGGLTVQVRRLSSSESRSYRPGYDKTLGHSVRRV